MQKENCENVGKYISQLYRRGGAFISKGMEKYNIGQGQFMFLMELYTQDGKNQEDLSKILKIDKGTTARAIKRLEEEGYVRREKDDHDKRSNKVFLTQKGMDIKDDIHETLSQWESKISQSIDEEERILMIKLLKKVCSNIDTQEDSNEE